MKLRVAKGIAFARSCGGGCRHSWQQIVQATNTVRRAIRRGSRLVSRSTPGWEYWPEDDKR